MGIAFDTGGNLFIADSQGWQVLEVASATGNIEFGTAATPMTINHTYRIATTTYNEYGGPSDVAFDTGGNLYIADSGNNAIREVGASYQAPGLPLSVVPASFMFVQQNEIGTPIRVSITYKQFILVASRHSSQVIGGRMEGSRRASIVSPVLVTNVIIKVIMCK